jgi:hypothetical protein
MSRKIIRVKQFFIEKELIGDEDFCMIKKKMGNNDQKKKISKYVNRRIN